VLNPDTDDWDYLHDARGIYKKSSLPSGKSVFRIKYEDRIYGGQSSYFILASDDNEAMKAFKNSLAYPRDEHPATVEKFIAL
jgi:hypothetical protein